jgi:hypothetical protein
MNAKCAVKFSCLKRLLSSLPLPELLTILGLIFADLTIVAILATANIPKDVSLILSKCIWIGFGVAIFLVLVLIPKTILEYRRLTFDYELISKYDEKFEGLDPARQKAAKVCKDYLNLDKSGTDEVSKWEFIDKHDRSRVEPILDFFEDLGFYLNGDQFSDLIVHHYFHHWIRGYYSILKSYVDFYRKESGDKSAYIFIEPLFQRVSVVEQKYEYPKLLLDTKEEKIDFIDDELEGEK